MKTFILVLSLILPCAARTASPHAEQGTPKLVIVIVVDQMRADYLVRFNDLFGNGGFNLFLNGGAYFTNCAYDYASTFTGPGHATILSGIPVRSSGIIGNEWFDRQKGRSVYCVEDSACESVGISPGLAAGRMSPRRFKGTTLGDQLMAHSPSSRVIGIAIKDRGAILLAGERPTGAFWFDPGSGSWITSSFYGRTLPAWAEQFNAAGIPARFLGRRWTRLLPDSCYSRSSIDDAPGEGTLPGEDRPVFPHQVKDLETMPPGGPPAGGMSRRFDGLLPTPFGDELTVRFAEAAIEGERLGGRGVTDLLAVSFSAPDYCGHIFGPDSQEVEDILVRLDRSLAEFFGYVDRRIGLQNVMVVLTADHGVCPLPELREHRGAIRINPSDVLLDVKVRVGQRFGYNEGKDNLILALSNSYLYLDLKGVSAHGFSADAFECGVIDAALREPGIVRCYT
ncbi:MAG TPA: alkaline phosphatase family protein, partial [Bacteroidota bacterium]|nr:alkaline phosphatase family protein [Bacteroidota bacterium]